MNQNSKKYLIVWKWIKLSSTNKDDNQLWSQFRECKVSRVPLKLLKKEHEKERKKKKEVAQHLGQILSDSVGFIAVPRDFHFRDDSSRGLSCQDNVLFFTVVLPWRSSAFTSPCSRRERGIVSSWVKWKC